MTSEQFTNLNKNIELEKNNLDTTFNELLSSIDTLSIERFNEIYSQGIDFFSKFETFVTSCSSEFECLSKIQVADILTSIENILEYSISFITTMKEISKEISINFQLQNNFLYTSQVILKTYRKESAKKIQNLFELNSLPTKGFISKEKFKLTAPKIDTASLITGIVLLSITTYIAFIVNINTGTQYWITRILGSLGTALIITAFSKHSIQAKINIPSYAITATGAIAVFLILYFSNPASEPQYNAKYSSKYSSVSESPLFVENTPQ